MVLVLTPSGPFYQLASFFLLASVACCDLITLRITLALGFAFLALWAGLGMYDAEEEDISTISALL